MRKLILFFVVILSLNTILKAQNPTVSTPNLSAAKGDTVLIPVDFTAFTNVGSFLIRLQYDPTVLQWLNPPELDSRISTTTVSEHLGTVSMQWVGQNGLNLASGTLIKLKFIYIGGSSQIRYLRAQSIVADIFGNALPAIYNNGSVSLKNYNLSITKIGNGQIKVNDTLRILPYSNLFPAGTQVKVEAVPDSGSQFSNWNGDVTGAANPVTIIMDTSKTVTANFSLAQFNLAINFSGDGSGTVKVNGTDYTLPYYGSFSSGTNVIIEAIPLNGNIFSGWSGDLITSSNPTSITMSGNKSIIVNFAKVIPYTLTLNKVGNGQIKVNDTLRVLPFTKVYNSGAQVKIEAIPDLENVFSGWSGDFIGTTNPVMISINGNKTIDANFILKQYSFTINKTGAGDGQVKVNGVLQALPYTGTFFSGTKLSFEAVPNMGNIFTAWDGDIKTTDNPVTIVVNKNMNVTANFDLARFVLSIAKAGSGSGQIKVEGILYSLPYSGSFTYNTNVAIEAVADTDSRFVSWTGNLTGVVNPTNISIDGNKTVQVNFNIIQYTLTINKGGYGQLKVNGSFVTLPYSALFNSGVKITIEAIPDTNYKFIGWSGDLTGNTNPVSITIDQDRVVTALFDVNIYSLTINRSGNGTGQVKVNGSLQHLPYAGTFSFGSQISVEAVADSGNSFFVWTGDITGNANPVTISMNGNKKITASFSIITYSLILNKGGNGSGQVKINGSLYDLPFRSSFNSGSEILLEAVPARGNTFMNWSGDLTGNKNSNTIKITRNNTITATFIINAPDLPVLKYPGNNNKYLPVSITLSWSNVAYAVSYHFQLSTDSSFSRIFINDSGLTVTNINVKSLQYKTKYFWRIRAKNSGGYSGFTNPWSFVTRIEPLGCPSNLRASTETGKVELQWNDNSTNELGYQIFRKNGDSLSSQSFVNIGSVGKNVTSFIDPYLNAGDIYTYLVYAYNTDTISCFSNLASIQAVTAVSDNHIPLKFALFQNYPNPFNTSTKIVFNLPTELSVSLRVYDMLGREVAVLINNEVKSAGNYTINFDASSLSSGEYFYLIRAGEFTAAKKFILLK